MKLSHLVGSLVLSLVAGSGFGQAEPINSVAQLVPRMEGGLAVQLSGEVLAGFDNELILLRDSAGEVALIELNEEHWALGIQPGYQITLTGKTVAADPKPAVAAETITVVSSRSRDTGRAYGKLVDLLERKRIGEPIAVLGTITKQDGRYVDLYDGTYTIPADFIDSEYALKYIAPREPMIFVGVLAERLEGAQRSRAMKVAAIKPLDFFRRTGDNMTVHPLKDVISARNVGALVRTEGNLIHYIGEESLPVLIMGEDVAILRLGKKYESLPVRAGTKVNVVGVVDFETHKGQEYLVLRDARVMP